MGFQLSLSLAEKMRKGILHSATNKPLLLHLSTITVPDFPVHTTLGKQLAEEFADQPRYKLHNEQHYSTNQQL